MFNECENVEKNCVSCGRCASGCTFLEKFNIDPKSYFAEFLKTKKADSIVPYSCFICGLCLKRCPVRLDLGKAFLEMRGAIVRQNGDVPIKRLGGVKVHQKLSFSGFFTFINKESG